MSAEKTKHYFDDVEDKDMILNHESTSPPSGMSMKEYYELFKEKGNKWISFTYKIPFFVKGHKHLYEPISKLK